MAGDTLRIVWLRQDLRLTDNPALFEAARRGAILPLYILDEVNSGAAAPGAASRWGLHHALDALNADLDGRLMLLRGDPLVLLPQLVEKMGAVGVYWNRCYEPWRMARDAALKERLRASGVEARSFNGSLMWEPWRLLKPDGDPYRVFTAFYRTAAQRAHAPVAPLPTPERLQSTPLSADSLPLAALNLLPAIRWDRKMASHWRWGEAAAQEQLADFLDQNLRGYPDGRDQLAQSATSKLSAALCYGALSPRQIWWATLHCADATGAGEAFRRQLAWREFHHNLLYHNPQMPQRALQPKFEQFPWREDADALARWRRGETGIPLVDAGMRELWATGYMHNRARMVVGSFLVKNLLLDWRAGARWFQECLVDFDLANNSGGWQWVAGCGVDAAPYFRVFNPVAQGQRFDATGDYVRRWVPELAGVATRWLFNPWEGPKPLGYPPPMVDLKASRERALAAFKGLPKPAAE
ncbi:cryptochrome/photolyase family protein [Magnetofaba australis]|uniref:Putative deoxyribodipyrimidine photo-lyase n=1 Tax=Magnetofaba australis IT-1 TaxID=1434232 RepID=A0A1Y2K2Z9_9PROT|nr:deoxyribodipyrimidine photo-lyase [Magnetofaba australis]OSM01996.1 putative deoxyribodipyrimidine photo-lyase [Magnetofaba australis IT-1]